MNGNHPATASFSDFAKIAGVRRSYITQLRNSGRLVLTDDGSAVRVAETLAKIEATRDPSKAGVAERHAAARAATLAADPAEVPIVEPAPNGEAPAAPLVKVVKLKSGYQKSRAKREHYMALEAQRAYETASGKLMDVDRVVDAINDAVAVFRTALENLPTTLGPLLAAEVDEGRCIAMLTEEIEHALAELSRKCALITAKPTDRHA